MIDVVVTIGSDVSCSFVETRSQRKMKDEEFYNNPVKAEMVKKQDVETLVD